MKRELGFLSIGCACREDGDFGNAHGTVPSNFVHSREAEVADIDCRKGHFLKDWIIPDIGKRALIDGGRPGSSISTGFETVGIHHASGISFGPWQIRKSANSYLVPHIDRHRVRQLYVFREVKG